MKREMPSGGHHSPTAFIFLVNSHSKKSLFLLTMGLAGRIPRKRDILTSIQSGVPISKGNLFIPTHISWRRLTFKFVFAIRNVLKDTFYQVIFWKSKSALGHALSSSAVSSSPPSRISTLPSFLTLPSSLSE